MKLKANFRLRDICNQKQAMSNRQKEKEPQNLKLKFEVNKFSM
jgi:hypothetical protein